MNEYINKQELLAKVEADMAVGKISQKDGNRIIRYIMQLTSEEVVKSNNAITYSQRAEVYRAAIELWGELQTMVAIEEMSELTKVLCKMHRGRLVIDDLADEIADVTIMMEQLRIMFNVNDLVCQHMDAKILRLSDRIAEIKGATDI